MANVRVDRARGALAGRLWRAGRDLKFGSDLIWRLQNHAARRAHVAAPPELGPVARRVLADLDRQGVALASLADVTGQPALLDELRGHAARLERVHAKEIAERRDALDAPGGAGMDKPFVFELLDRARPVVNPDDVLARLALHPQLRGVADCYTGVRTRVADVNIWRSLRTERPAESSQLWHRDLREDRYVVKMFVYLEDVDEGNGALSYLLGSHTKGSARRLSLPGQWGERALRAPETAPLDGGLEQQVATFPGPAGTVVFADTLGWHRGGHARTRDRLVCQVLYGTRAGDGHRMLGLPVHVDPAAHSADLAYDAGARRRSRTARPTGEPAAGEQAHRGRAEHEPVEMRKG